MVENTEAFLSEGLKYFFYTSKSYNIQHYALGVNYPLQHINYISNKLKYLKIYKIK